MQRTYDAIVVGQGLAGTALAWYLREAGWDVLVLDRGDASTASQVSAGLITPITGMRFGIAYAAAELEECRAFYRLIEAATKRRFFFDRTAVRLFAAGWEERLWARRKDEPAMAEHIAPMPPASQVSHLKGSIDAAFAMHAAQVDVPQFRDAPRAALPVERIAVDWRRDVSEATDHVRVGTYRARCVVACEGFAGAMNPYFARIPFKAAKGDILTVRFAQPLPPISLHKGIWLAPTDDACIFKVGATFDWLRLDAEPSPAARLELETKLADLVTLPFEVIEHRAAIRPIIAASQPRIGLHPASPRIAYFNGLGTKGALRAPLFAARLGEHLMHGRPLARTIDLRTLLEPALAKSTMPENGRAP